MNRIKSSTLIVLCVPLLIVILCYCAPKKSLHKYPERYIDRPYVLPFGINAWSSTIYYKYVELKPNFAGTVKIEITEEPPGMYPFIWEYSVFKNISFIWNDLLPLGIRYQLINTPETLLGINAHMNLGFKSGIKGGVLDQNHLPFLYGLSYVSIYYRKRINAKLAWDINPLVSWDEKRKMSLSVLSVLGSIVYQASNSSAFAANIGGQQISLSFHEKSDKTQDLSVGVKYVYNFKRQFDLNIEYNLNQNIHSNNYYSLGYFSIVHYW